jgi:hypothetical protein
MSTACMHGRVDMVRHLLAAGPHTVDIMDHDNFTSLSSKECDPDPSADDGPFPSKRATRALGRRGHCYTEPARRTPADPLQYRPL